MLYETWYINYFAKHVCQQSLVLQVISVIILARTHKLYELDGV